MTSRPRLTMHLPTRDFPLIKTIVVFFLTNRKKLRGRNKCLSDLSVDSINEVVVVIGHFPAVSI